MEYLGDRVFLFVASKAGEKVAKKFLKASDPALFSPITLQSMDPEKISQDLNIAIDGFSQQQKDEVKSKDENESKREKKKFKDESQSKSEKKKSKDERESKYEVNSNGDGESKDKVNSKEQNGSREEQKNQNGSKEDKKKSKNSKNAPKDHSTDDSTKINNSEISQEKDKFKPKPSKKEENPLSPLPPTPSISPQPQNSSKRPGIPFKRVNPEEVVFLREELKNNDFAFKKNSQGSYGERAYIDLKDTRGKDFRQEKNKKKKGSYRGGKIDTNSVCSVKFDSDSE